MAFEKYKHSVKIVFIYDLATKIVFYLSFSLSSNSSSEGFSFLMVTSVRSIVLVSSSLSSSFLISFLTASSWIFLNLSFAIAQSTIMGRPGEKSLINQLLTVNKSLLKA